MGWHAKYMYLIGIYMFQSTRFLSSIRVRYVNMKIDCSTQAEDKKTKTKLRSPPKKKKKKIKVEVDPLIYSVSKNTHKKHRFNFKSLKNEKDHKN